MKWLVSVVAAIALLLLSPVSAPASPTAEEPGGTDPHDHEHSLDEHHEVDETYVAEEAAERVPLGEFGHRGGRSIAAVPASLRSCQHHTNRLRGAPPIRRAAGLGQDLPTQAMAGEQRLGFNVTAAEAAKIDRAGALRRRFDPLEMQSIVDSEHLLGVQWSPTDERVIVYLTAQSLGVEEVQASLGWDAPVAVSVVDSDVSAAKLEAARGRVFSQIRDMDKIGDVAVVTDITCAKVLILVESAADLGPIRRAMAWSGAAKQMVIVHAPGFNDEPASRNDHHHNDQDGGLAIRAVDETTGFSVGDCTSAIPFHNSSRTGQYAITAAHCLGSANSEESTSRRWACNSRVQQGGYWLHPADYCIRYQLGGRVDVLAVWKYSWEGGGPETMIHGGNHTMIQMDGWNWDRDQVWIGDWVCHSGRNWAGAYCGSVESNSYSMCRAAQPPRHPAFCVEDMFDSTMAAIDGDSGATVWHEPSGYGRNWGRFYTGVVHSTGGAFTHIEDLRASLGLGPPVGF